MPRGRSREGRKSGDDKSSENFLFRETRHLTPLEECHGNA